MSDSLTVDDLIYAHQMGWITNLRWEIIGEEAYVYFTPTKPIEYIQLNFVAIRSNVSFEEIIGSNNAIRDK